MLLNDQAGNCWLSHQNAGMHRGALWSSLRAAVQPMFHSNHLEAYASTINQAVSALMLNLDEAVELGQQVDIYRHFGRVTMQVIGAAAFG